MAGGGLKVEYINYMQTNKQTAVPSNSPHKLLLLGLHNTQSACLAGLFLRITQCWQSQYKHLMANVHPKAAAMCHLQVPVSVLLWFHTMAVFFACAACVAASLQHVMKVNTRSHKRHRPNSSCNLLACIMPVPSNPLCTTLLHACACISWQANSMHKT